MRRRRRKEEKEAERGKRDANATSRKLVGREKKKGKADVRGGEKKMSEKQRIRRWEKQQHEKTNSQVDGSPRQGMQRG